jgi:hypothetical protein
MVNRNSIIEKVKALLAKTTENGCTEEEELAALAKVRAWIDAHEITDDELQLSQEEKAIPIRSNGSWPMPLNDTATRESIVTAPRPALPSLV